jgi:hypothetical protein
LQDAARNFCGKLRDSGFDVTASSGKLRRHARFRRADFA